MQTKFQKKTQIKTPDKLIFLLKWLGQWEEKEEDDEPESLQGDDWVKWDVLLSQSRSN